MGTLSKSRDTTIFDHCQLFSITTIFDLFSIYAEVHSRHSGPGGQVAERLLDSDEAAALLGIHRDTGGFLKRLQSTLK
jgi:hypothetical protein